MGAKGGNGGGGGGEKGGGKGGGGGGGEITPIKITFGDEMGASGYRISGDGLGQYVHDADGSGDGVEAYLGAGGAEGDIFLRLANAPSRGIFFDFTDCHPEPGSCSPPFDMGVDFASGLAAAPGETVDNGLFGMTAGQTIDAPMEFIYAFDSGSGPGNVHFDSGLKGKNPCKNKSLNATITRPGAEQVWTVSVDASVLACATLPGGAYSGQYLMPFVFTVEVLP
ncbi:MAG: hypothetical protein R3244_04965 [Thermoanaerobaculia bacterium]|nr:hypothetical protein [Thermoanaerobaculia bacterium]